ncbi:MAG: amidohydrolase [Bacteroidia bacterium]|nr:amidohydrolase [Bacteroidia bacterium]
MNDLNVTLVQSKLYWEDREKNLKHFTALLKKLKRGSSDIIILPEMFATGFSMNSKMLAEKMDGESIAWMRKLASEKNAVVTGSLIIKEGDDCFNRLIWMAPEGSLRYYDKRHLFRMAKEDQHYAAGRQKLILEYKGWRICPMICYDLRFPVWCRNTSSQKYDLILFVANWPVKRISAWRQLLISRAIENQCYVAGVNRIGKDGNGISYNGHSALINPTGKKISRMRAGVQSMETIKLSAHELEKTRRALPFLNDADEFDLTI